MKLARRSPFKLFAALLCVVCITLGTVSALAVSQIARYGGYNQDRAGFVSSMQAPTLQEDIYNVSQYYSLLMNGLPWTESMIADYRTAFSRDSTNFFFTVKDYVTGETLLYNYRDEAGSSATNEFYLSAADVYNYYGYDGVSYYDYTTNEPVEESAELTDITGQVADNSLRHVIITGSVSQSFHTVDKYTRIHDIAQRLYDLRTTAIVMVAACSLVFLLSFALVLYGAGRRPGTEEIRLRLLDRMPWDVLLVLGVGFGVLGSLLWDFFIQAFATYFYTIYNEKVYLAVALAALYGGILLMLMFTSFAARCKSPGWLKNSLVYRLFHWLGELLHHPLGQLGQVLRALPLVWKTVLFCGCCIAVECLCLYQLFWDGNVVPIILLNVLIFLVMLTASVHLKKLQQGCRAIADGDMEFRVDTKFMGPDFRAQGEDLNRIGSSIAVAVEDRLKSERFKTELITNVSHDLKTPLTSIVNYVDLLSKLDLPRDARAYVEVLQRQSARLKKLTEDLVEASKASTGNLSVEITTVMLGELVSQVTGEYEDRFQKAGLYPVLQLPEGKIPALGDGRYLWRIMDNLFSNVCKYALSGTRVYIDASIQDGFAVIDVKNISRDRLNVSADALMERCVRGDASRNTEGSGLGLSIARSLAELMGGTLSLTVDGDLFKAEMRLPMAPQEPTE